MSPDRPAADAPEHPDDDRSTGPDRPPRLVSIVEEREGAPDVLTLYPADVGEEALFTSWLSAEGDSYVDLAEMR